MTLLENIPTNYNISLAFIVFMMAFMAVYMAVRCFRRLDALSIIVFAIQLCAFTSGVLTIINRVLSVPLYEIVIIVSGLLLPGVLISDYIGMKNRIKKSLTDAPLIEKLERQSHKSWKYNEYLEELDEWKPEIQPGIIANTIDLRDKHLKTNINRQLVAVHKLIDNGDFKQALDIYTILSELLRNNAHIIYNTAWLSYKNGLYGDAIQRCKKHCI